MFFDCHCHISELNIFEELLTFTENFYCNSLLTIADFDEALPLKTKFKNLLFSFGLHPLYLKTEHFNKNWVIDNIKYIDAIGEIGLDTFSQSNIEFQKKVFIEQLEFADCYNRLVIIHSRKTYYEIYKIFKTQKFQTNIAFHNFTGNIDIAEKLLEFDNVFFCYTSKFQNFNFSKKNAVNLMPIDKILFETDAPYISNYAIDDVSKNYEIFIKELAQITKLNSDCLKSKIFENSKLFFKIN